MNDKKMLTRKEFNRLKQELEDLKSKDRPEIARRLQEAKAHGDLSENAEYSEARESQSFLEGRIQFLENMLSNASVVDIAKKCPNFVTIGTMVQVTMDGNLEQEFEIVSAESADPLNSRISIESPLGQALDGLKAGDETEFETPGGRRKITIKAIRC